MKKFVTKKIVLTLVALGIVAYMALPYFMGPQRGGFGRGPVPVIVTEVAFENWEQNIQAIGSLKANEQVELTTSVSGKVENINFTDGQQVKKGSILLQIDAGEERADLEAAKSLLNETKRQYERSRELRKQGATSQSVLDGHRREFETAKAQVGVVQARLEDRTIRAPFSGHIGLRQVSPGSFMQGGDKIAILTDNSTVRLDFSVPETLLSFLKEGLDVQATSRAYPQDTFSGKISALESYVDPLTRSVGVRAVLPNDDGKLNAGMMMVVQISLPVRQTIVIPEVAIVQEGAKKFVYVVNEEAQPPVAIKTDVNLGSRKEGVVEVIDGLNEGEQVIIHGVIKLADQRPINVVATKTDENTIKEILKSLGQQRKPKGGQ